MVNASSLESVDCAKNLMWNAGDIGPEVDTGGVDAYGQDETLGEFECLSLLIDGSDSALGINTSDYKVKLAYKENSAGSGLIAMLPGITTDFDAYDVVCDHLLDRYQLRACLILGTPLNGGSDYAKYDYSDWYDYDHFWCPGCIAELEDVGFANAQSARLQQLAVLPDFLELLGGSADELKVLAGWSTGGLGALTMDTYADDKNKDLRTTYGIDHLLIVAPIPPDEVEFTREDETEIWSTLLSETFDALEYVSPYGIYLDLDDSPYDTCTDGGVDGDSIPSWYEIWWGDSEADDPQDTIYGPLPPSDKLLPLCAAANNFESAEYAFEAFGVTASVFGVGLNPGSERPSADQNSLAISSGYKTAWLTFIYDPYIGRTDTTNTCSYLTGITCSETTNSARMFRSDNSHASFLAEQTNSAESAQGVEGLDGAMDWLLANPQISVKNVYTQEGTKAHVIVSLATPALQPMTLTYKAIDGTAKYSSLKPAYTDYYGGSGTFTIERGETTADLYFRTTTAGGTEGSEYFSVQVSDADSSTNTATATVTLVEGTIKTVSVLDTSVTEGDSAIVHFQLSCSVTTCASTDGNVTATYETQNESAGSGGDYQSKKGSVTFSQSGGETDKTISVFTYLNGDSGDESFKVKITGISAGIAAVGDDTASVLILDNPDDEPVEDDDGGAGENDCDSDLPDGGAKLAKEQCAP